MPLVESRYGKGRVRVARLHRDGERHTVRDLSVKVLLTGGFDASYTVGDNRTVIATDTIKNIVNVVAHENLAAENEAFAEAVARFFLDRYAHVSKAEVWTEETRWRRLAVDGAAHDHGFVLDGNGTPTVQVAAAPPRPAGPPTRQAGGTAATTSGIAGFTFLKTTQSGWADFHSDEFRTLPDTHDRFVGTSMAASWDWSAAPTSYEAANATVLDTMMRTFLGGYSPGVQNSMYLMAEAALAAVPQIARMRMALPNKHYIPMNLSAFGRENKGEVFLPTDEPHGQIEAVIARG